MIKLGIDARIVQDKSSGLVSYTQNLISGIADNPSFELFIFGQQKYKSIFDSFLPKAHFVPVYFDPQFLSLKNFLHEQLFLYQTVNAYKLNVFHSPFGYGIPFSLQTKTVLTIHDIIPLYPYDKLTLLQKFVYKMSLGVSLNKSSHIVTISQFTKNDLLKMFPRLTSKPISVIHDGFDNLASLSTLPIFRALKEQYKLPEDYVVYLGSGTKRKNLIRLTQAFILWKKQKKEKHKLVFISKFNRPETAKTFGEIKSLLSKEGLEEEIIHVPYVNNNEKATLLSHARLFIYPSIYEGFGLPLLEAASCNVPVCCSDLPVFHEVCAQAAYYFNPYDPLSISQAIDVCLHDESLKNTMIQKGKERLSFFSWEKMVCEYINIYNSIVKT